MDFRTLVYPAFSTLKSQGPSSLVKVARRKAREALVKPSQTAATFDLDSELFAIDEKTITMSKHATESPFHGVHSALWFMPYSRHITYGGHYTVYRFVEYMAQHGISSTVVIYTTKFSSPAKLRNTIAERFPDLADLDLLYFDPERQSVNDLPRSDVAFATYWTSAYLLLKYNHTNRKYYFIQDYEPFFYQPGTQYALAESTYRFGFHGIVNTPGLLDAIQERHGMEGVSFVPAVDPKYYYPPANRPTNRPPRVFFYLRPMARNARELCILTIKELLAKYGDKVEIVTAGAKWDEASAGLKGRISNLGLLNSLQSVGDLYRTCDIGVIYMLSKNPSYQPFEYMACGMATVANRNEDNLWFLRDGENCLLSEPSPLAMAGTIGRLIEDDRLRQEIAATGRESVSHDWSRSLQVALDYVLVGGSEKVSDGV